MNPVQVSTVLSVSPASARPSLGPQLAVQAPRVAFRTVLLQERALVSAPDSGPWKPSPAVPPVRPGSSFQLAAAGGRGPLVRPLAKDGSPTLGAEEASHRERADVDDALDPRQRARHSALDWASTQTPLAPSGTPVAQAVTGTQAAASPSVRAAASLEDLLPALVRRIAWSGDGQRGSVRLELGAGELAGGTLLVHADAGRVSVHLDVPPGADPGVWQRRLQERLALRGVATDAVEVT